MKRFLLGFTALFLLSFSFISCSKGAFFNSYKPSESAISVLKNENHEGLTIEQRKGLYIIYPEEYKAGFIFYPGGKVKVEAYLPICKAIAEKGFFTLLVEMPDDLAIFGVNAANVCIKSFPEIEHWFIGGHSLGGAMAGTYVSKHPEKIEGIAFLAAFSTSKISNNEKVLSIYGSCDEVLSAESYQKNKDNLPSNMTEIVIEGGIHSYFGDYGHQEGDGYAAISLENQIQITVDAIADLFLADL